MRNYRNRGTCGRKTRRKHDWIKGESQADVLIEDRDAHLLLVSPLHCSEHAETLVRVCSSLGRPFRSVGKWSTLEGREREREEGEEECDDEELHV